MVSISDRSGSRGRLWTMPCEEEKAIVFWMAKLILIELFIVTQYIVVQYIQIISSDILPLSSQSITFGKE